MNSGSFTTPSELAELYGPLQATNWVAGHLGQSLDGRIATATGASCYVTSNENLDHLHRMRALADAVIIGAGTVRHDNPQLTVRRVEGRNPLRVILDTHGRLHSRYGVFNDEQAETLLVSGVEENVIATACARTVFLRPDATSEQFRPREVLDLLRAHGLQRLFVEGGGITVSRFLQTNCLDRLHICVAPVIIGQGIRGIDLPACERMEDTLRPPARWYSMGQDVLFDLDLRP
ncbi:RibD family protein [Fodinicurvata halophila]|uniref:RibD family protein n=1 Tax=Fodinicurvata halophila TaxID=1419723 RepID=A0ABV8UJW6_9PROT